METNMFKFYFTIFSGLFSWSFTHAQKMPSFKTIQQKFNACCRDLTSSQITAKEATQNHKKYLFVDARSKEERSISTIPGSITPSQLESTVLNKPVIIYCTIGYRSGKLTAKLIEKGYKDIYNLEGGILAWTWANGPLIDINQKQTKKVHTWSDDWNLLPKNYQGTSQPSP